MADYCDTPVTLTLSLPNGPTLDLMSDQQGFRVSEFDPGYPDVREDANLRPGQHGTIDLTRLFGARAVTITGFIVPTPAGGSRQKAWHALAPFLDPNARPVLTYQIDSDASPRTMTLRVSDFAAPANSPKVSIFHVGFKAADPLAYDATIKSAVTYTSAYGYTTGGRAYSWTPNRFYPPGGYSTAGTTNMGDFTAWPLLYVYGPITAAQVIANVVQGGKMYGAGVGFQASYIIPAGSYVLIDTRRRTAYLNGDPGQSVYSQLVPGNTWPWIPPATAALSDYTQWTLNGSNTSNTTQLQIQWQDAYLL